MRIGIDVRSADPAEPGQQRYLWRLGAWLGGSGHDVHFLTVRPQSPDTTEPPSTTLHRLHGIRRAALRRRVEALELDALLLNPERSRSYRGVAANVLRAGYGTEHYSQKLRSFRNPAELALRRGLRLAPWVLAERRWERAFYEDTAPPPEVVAQSEYMRGEILGSYRIPEDRVHVIHNAVDLEEFSTERRLGMRARMRARWGVPEDALCLLFLGHNFRLKGLWQILGALAGSRTRGRQPHLLVAGRGTGGGQRRKAKRLVEAMGLGERVTLAGPVRPSIEAYAAADALLHVSWHDSFGFVALEAMACGLPVVTTRYAGASELVRHGLSGLLIEPEDDGALVEAIEQLDDEATRDRLGSAAGDTAARHPEVANFRRVLSVVETAARRAARPIAAT